MGNNESVEIFNKEKNKLNNRLKEKFNLSELQ